jgi:hypothetical protein
MIAAIAVIARDWKAKPNLPTSSCITSGIVRLAFAITRDHLITRFFSSP